MYKNMEPLQEGFMGDTASYRPPPRTNRVTIGFALLSLIILLLFIALIGVIIGFTVTMKSTQKPNIFSQLKYAKKLKTDGSVTVALFSPAGTLSGNFTEYQERVSSELTQQFYNTKVRFAPHAFDKMDTLAGTDEDRVGDINALVQDSSVQFMMSNRGGWGCLRIIDRIKYDQIVKNPKVIMGYSDLTACLNSIFFQTGLIVFHGPMGVNSFVAQYNTSVSLVTNQNALYMQKVLYNNELTTFTIPPPNGPTIIKSGTARGRLLGGNLSVFVSMIGTDFFPPKTPYSVDWKDVILFFEEISESPQHVDMFMTKLRLYGILDQIAGFVFGTCVNCDTPAITKVLRTYVTNCPAFSGTVIGHDGQQFTIPIGGLAEIDADKGEIRLLEKVLLD